MTTDDSLNKTRQTKEVPSSHSLSLSPIIVIIILVDQFTEMKTIELIGQTNPCLPVVFVLLSPFSISTTMPRPLPQRSRPDGPSGRELRP